MKSSGRYWEVRSGEALPECNRSNREGKAGKLVKERQRVKQWRKKVQVWKGTGEAEGNQSSELNVDEGRRTAHESTAQRFKQRRKERTQGNGRTKF